jgi:hypothetical protein
MSCSSVENVLMIFNWFLHHSFDPCDLYPFTDEERSFVAYWKLRAIGHDTVGLTVTRTSSHALQTALISNIWGLLRYLKRSGLPDIWD